MHMLGTVSLGATIVITKAGIRTSTVSGNRIQPTINIMSSTMLSNKLPNLLTKPKILLPKSTKS